MKRSFKIGSTIKNSSKGKEKGNFKETKLPWLTDQKVPLIQCFRKKLNNKKMLDWLLRFLLNLKIKFIDQYLETPRNKLVYNSVLQAPPFLKKQRPQRKKIIKNISIVHLLMTVNQAMKLVIYYLWSLQHEAVRFGSTWKICENLITFNSSGLLIYLMKLLCVLWLHLENCYHRILTI